MSEVAGGGQRLSRELCGGLKANAVKRFDKRKNSKIKTNQIALQAWTADTPFAVAVMPCHVQIQGDWVDAQVVAEVWIIVVG